MTGLVKVLEEGSNFQNELAVAVNKLVVVDFYADWCGPCRNIAPIFAQLASKYTNVVFLKIDVDKFQSLSQREGVSAMPTFNFYRDKNKVDSIRGADPAILEAKIKKWQTTSGSSGSGESEGPSVKGHSDLSPFYSTVQCECLNESDEHPLAHALTSKGGYLESDCDEQLIISIHFNQTVKLHSLIIHAPKDKGPKTVKIFVNQPGSLDFDQAESNNPTQQLELTPTDLESTALIQLKYVKYQNVSSVTLFVKDNQEGEETTQIDYLSFIGSALSTTNMSDFKRVAGKKGESHFT